MNKSNQNEPAQGSRLTVPFHTATQTWEEKTPWQPRSGSRVQLRVLLVLQSNQQSGWIFHQKWCISPVQCQTQNSNSVESSPFIFRPTFAITFSRNHSQRMCVMDVKRVLVVVMGHQENNVRCDLIFCSHVFSEMVKLAPEEKIFVVLVSTATL